MVGSICGSSWLDTCSSCQKNNTDCCRNIELALFPDEIKPFIKRGVRLELKREILASGVEFERYVYNTERCTFLNKENLCELQLSGRRKPTDCLIYPVNYKLGRIFLDHSCPGVPLLNVDEAKQRIKRRLAEYPEYRNLDYIITPADELLEVIP